jgi:hypothetical protein
MGANAAHPHHVAARPGSDPRLTETAMGRTRVAQWPEELADGTVTVVVVDTKALSGCVGLGNVT